MLESSRTIQYDVDPSIVDNHYENVTLLLRVCDQMMLIYCNN